MYDPDSFELEESEQIGIFVPGSDVEREVNWDRFFRVLLLTGAGFGFTIALTVVLIIPLTALGLISLNPYTFEIYFAPYVFLFLSLTELGFIIPPIWYVRKHGLSLKAIGLKFPEPLKDILLGLLVGVIMLIAMFIITWAIAVGTGLPLVGDESLFSTNDPMEVIGWVLMMFLVIGFSEELIFRGFLQRRMELYLRQKTVSYKSLALIITSVIFSAMHLDIIGLPGRFVLGLFLGYLAQKRKYSILGPTVAHGFHNAAIVILAAFGF
ncbi:MAG: CPBP family intramembrane glutamic endopeptidase [Candidatus Thorarchaeota archaeon]|jgi:membrane protease YdiL (CAAX protease family)